MREQSGRSLIEIIGVLTIGAIMTAATYGIYMTISQRSNNMVASETLKDIATKTKILLEHSGYKPVSVDYLVEKGVIKTNKAPMGKPAWSITSNYDGSEFSINLSGLNYGECSYFSVKKLDWAERVSINNSESQETALCLKEGDNHISFFVK